MAIQTQGNSEALSRAFVASYLAFRKEYAAAASKVHADITSQPTTGDYRHPAVSAFLVTADDAADQASLATLCRDIYRVLTTHFADTLAHKAADTTNTIAFGLPATNETVANLVTFVNQAKAALNAHRSQAGVHCTNDAGNAVSSADATDQASAITVANEAKGDLNAHIQASLTSPSIQIIGE